MMKRILTYLIAALFLTVSAGTIQAVEKKDKQESKKIEVKKTDSKKKPPKKTSEKKKPIKSSNQKKLKNKKYDNFVDKNNNGIDDRKEKLKKVDKEKKEKKKK